jgi:hypothetical protein
MSNSGDKWPVGYKGLVSAITPIPPVLYYDSCQSTLYWTYEYCLPVSSVNIYKDGQFYKVVPAPLTSTPLNDLVPGQTYTFTAKSVLYGTESEVSNSVTITIPGPPVNLTSIVLDQSSVELSWDLPVGPITNFNIYQNGVLIGTVSPTTDTYVVTGLSLNTLYAFGVSIVYGCGSETTQSTTSLEITETIVFYSQRYVERQQVSSDPGSYYIIIENDGTDNSPITGPGQTGVVTLTITSGVPITVNMLIVGGGGGGACGNLINGIYSGGGGGGGGGIYYNSAITIPLNTPVTINVGCAGLGRPANSGQGNSTGASGGASSLSFNSNTYTANGGGGGFGIGTTTVGGGSGGSGGTNGGGGGGGAGSDKSGPKLGGPGGSGSIFNGNTGTNGTSTSAGNGASSGISTILLPTTIPQITLNLSGGGGGGSNSGNSVGGKGGLAGPSGLGGQNTITNGQGAIYGILTTMGYYGNGGGGAGNSGAGGKGSKGVVILWIQ